VGVLATLLLLPAFPPSRLAAQIIPDARTIPAGTLRISFMPQYRSWDAVFGTDGTVRPLGFYFLTDTTSRLFPDAAQAEAAVRSITGDATWVLTAGRIDPRLDADVRRFPFEFSLGLASWLTVRATIPLITTTMNASPSVDTTGANAGLATFDAGAAGTAAGALLATADQVAAAIADGQFGCPLDPACGDAATLEQRARRMAVDLVLLGASPLQPLSTSGAATAINNAVAQLLAELGALGFTPSAFTLSFAEAPLDTTALGALVSDLELSPLAPSKHTRKLGDIELGARIAILARPGVRLLADLMARLPTASRGRPLDPIELAPGDRQLDVGLALEGAVEGQWLSLWVRGSMEIQRAGTADLRVAAPDDPLAPASTLATVSRDPGDITQLSVWPGLRLTEGLRVSMTADWYRRGADRVTLNGAPVPALEVETAQSALAFGGGLWYRSERGRRAAGLPIEAGLVYRSVFTGSGGRTPRSRQLDFGLRLYYGL
jgi:hypothetical protein